MRYKYIAAGTLIVLIAAQACTGYRDLKNEVKTYQPPSYLPAQALPGADPAKPLTDNDFMASKKRIAEAQAGWEEALTSPDDKMLFFRPDSKIWELMLLSRAQSILDSFQSLGAAYA